MNRILCALAAAVLAPSAALAQSPTQTLNVTGEVAPACVLGTPSNATLTIGSLSGADGRLLPALAGSAPAAQTAINNAWCNTPSNITLTASPLSMVTPPVYAQQAGFSRSITYSADLTNWSGPVSNRPLTAGNAVTVAAAGAQAAAPSLGVVFSKLTPLVNGAETPTAFIEAGAYTATISVSLAAAS